MKKLFSSVKYWAFLNLGILMMSVGIYFFKTPNSFATGGVSGISIVLAILFPQISQATYMLIINVILLIIAIKIIGVGFGGKTIFAILMTAVCLNIFPKIIPAEFITEFAVSSSKLPVGSSASITLGEFIMARAIATR